MTGPAQGAARLPAAELRRTLVGLAAVLAGAALLLLAADAVPAWIAGEPRDVRRVASVAEAERRLRVRLFLPGYFPDTIVWPPRTVRMTGGPQAGAALEFDGSDGRPRMLLVQAARPGEISERLLPPAQGLDPAPAPLGAIGGTLRRIEGADGEVWQELSWRRGERRVVLRLRGTVEQAVRMARSAREEQ
jgi:hypothetical protein